MVDDCLSLAQSEDEQAHLISVLDLAGVIQFALIAALEMSAKSNGYKIKQDVDHDGWYDFRGSIDTFLVSCAIANIARKKMLHAADKGG